MMEFVRNYFDKLALILLFIILTILVEHAVHTSGVDMVNINWLENLDGQVIAALLALLYGDKKRQIEDSKLEEEKKQ